MVNDAEFIQILQILFFSVCVCLWFCALRLISNAVSVKGSVTFLGFSYYVIETCVRLHAVTIDRRNICKDLVTSLINSIDHFTIPFEYRSMVN